MITQILKNRFRRSGFDEHYPRSSALVFNQRTSASKGAALLVVIMTAVVFSIAAFTVLIVAFSALRRSRTEPAFRARYASEAGLVFAMQQLWANPDYPHACCSGGCAGSTKTDALSIDTDGVGGPDTMINITVTNCGANNTHALSAQVTY